MFSMKLHTNYMVWPRFLSMVSKIWTLSAPSMTTLRWLSSLPANSIPLESCTSLLEKLPKNFVLSVLQILSTKMPVLPVAQLEPLRKFTRMEELPVWELPLEEFLPPKPELPQQQPPILHRIMDHPLIKVPHRWDKDHIKIRDHLLLIKGQVTIKALLQLRALKVPPQWAKAPQWIRDPQWIKDPQWIRAHQWTRVPQIIKVPLQWIRDRQWTKAPQTIKDHLWVKVLHPWTKVFQHQVKLDRALALRLLIAQITPFSTDISALVR